MNETLQQFVVQKSRVCYADGTEGTVVAVDPTEETFDVLWDDETSPDRNYDETDLDSGDIEVISYE